MTSGTNRLGRWLEEGGARASESVDAAVLAGLAARVLTEPVDVAREVAVLLQSAGLDDDQDAALVRLSVQAEVAASGPRRGPARAVARLEGLCGRISDLAPHELLGCPATELAHHPGLDALQIALTAAEPRTPAWARLRSRLLARLPPAAEEVERRKSQWESGHRCLDLHRLADALVLRGAPVEAAEVLSSGARRVREARRRHGVIVRAWHLALKEAPALSTRLAHRAWILHPSVRALLRLVVPMGEMGQLNGVLDGVLDDLYESAEEEPALEQLCALAELLRGEDDLVAARLDAADGRWDVAGHPAPVIVPVWLALGVPAGARAPRTLPAVPLGEAGSPVRVEGPPPSVADPDLLARALQHHRPQRLADRPWFRGQVGAALERRFDAVRGQSAAHEDFAAVAVAWAQVVAQAEGDDAARAALERLARRSPRHRAIRRALSVAAVAAGLGPRT